MHMLVARAEAFARGAHMGQMRKGKAKEPYAIHLEQVADFVARHGGDPVAVAVAWLHDTVEDCPVPIEAIRDLFGPEVAGPVAELTDDKALAKAERKRMQVVNAPHKSPRAALVKLGDKTSNLLAVARSPSPDWSAARCRDYVRWGAEVVSLLPALPSTALAEFLSARDEALASIGRREASGEFEALSDAANPQ